MTKLERARQLRADPIIHYNCAQSVLLPFVEALGLDAKQAYDSAALFGSGMQMGSVCGALSGALMALGLLGADKATAAALIEDFRALEGSVDCAALLDWARERGMEQRPHCNALIEQTVALVEKHAPSV